MYCIENYPKVEAFNKKKKKERQYFFVVTTVISYKNKVHESI